MSDTFLKSLADKLTEADAELTKLKEKAKQMASEKKGAFDVKAEEVKKQAAMLKGKIDEYKGKSKEELKAEGEDLLRQASGAIANGLKDLSSFFEEKSKKPV